jgi:uncharacterized protein (DUF1501 family)
MMTMLSRRHTLAIFGAGAATLGAGAWSASFAAAPTDKRFIFIILRGALDGLAAVPPYFDRDYRAARGALAFSEPGTDTGALDLDGKFGLNPALASLHDLYKQNELIVLHAVATPYRARSHFDAQDLLENGTERPRGAADGWLNRALGLLGSGDQRLGLAVGQTVPLLLRGTTPVGSWAPQQMPELDVDFLQRLAALYSRDAVLGPAIAEGLRAQGMNDDVLGSDRKMGGAALRGPQAIRTIATNVGKLLADPRGARVAVLEIGGWDTHANQGLMTGRLAAQLKALSEAVAAIKESLGPVWAQTVVAIATEFGRTVAINGTNGTDHGTAGVAFIAGGNINGGRVVTRWPGLGASQLFEGRDLAPTMDLRAPLKAVLRTHLGLPADAIDRAIFPDSRAVAALPDLIKV